MFLICFVFIVVRCGAQELLATLDFTGYNGSGLTTSANSPGMLNAGIWRVQASLASKTSYDVGTTTSDFARGLVKYANRNTDLFAAGGIGAIELSGNTSLHRALFLVQSSSAFSTGFIEFRLPFDVPASVAKSTLFEIDFEFWILNLGTRSSEWQFGYFVGSATPNDTDIVDQPMARVFTPTNSSGTPTWTQQKLKLAFTVDVKPGDKYFFGRFTGLDNNGTGTRDVIAIDSINVLGYECPAGTLLCPCVNGSCNATLTCSSGTCTKPCPLMSDGCPCGANDACDAGLQCTSNVTSSRVCTVGGCTPGSPGCACTPLGLCDATSCIGGKCNTLTCPPMPMLVATCASQCAASSVKVCACQAGVVNIQCNNVTATTASMTSGGTAATSSPATTNANAGNETTAAGGNGNATTLTETATTPPTTAAETMPTTQTTAAPVNCAKMACKDCITNDACLWCGNSRQGACSLLINGVSCGFQPVSSATNCPISNLATNSTLMTEPSTTFVDTFSSGRVVEEADSQSSSTFTLIIVAAIIVPALILAVLFVILFCLVRQRRVVAVSKNKNATNDFGPILEQSDVMQSARMNADSVSASRNEQEIASLTSLQSPGYLNVSKENSPVVHYEVIAPDATFNYKRSSAGFVDIGALQEEFSQIRH